MSLAIDLDQVVRVLLPDGWYSIEPSSLEVDSYELHHSDPNPTPASLLTWPLRGGSAPEVATLGFTFRRRGRTDEVSGPITSLLAVETEVST